MTSTMPHSSATESSLQEVKGVVFEIQKFSIHDGPGIRTTVFLKGCPLRCQWCHNPEGLSPKPELMVRAQNCIECHSCEQVCPQGATHPALHHATIDRDSCTTCGDCEEVCPAEGLKMVGKTMTAKDVIKKVMRDVDYYKNSGGGLTLSGGEVMLQPKFAHAILSLAKAEGIHTCVETSCFTSEKNLLAIAPLVDHWLMDIKAWDGSLHRKLTGVDNQIILSNITMLNKMGVSMTLRLPVIPGLNDHRENLEACASFIKSLPCPVSEVQLLPYHDLGEGKKANLGMDTSKTCSQSPAEATVDLWHAWFHEWGVMTSRPN